MSKREQREKTKKKKMKKKKKRKKKKKNEKKKKKTKKKCDFHTRYLLHFCVFHSKARAGEYKSCSGTPSLIVLWGLCHVTIRSISCPSNSCNNLTNCNKYILLSERREKFSFSIFWGEGFLRKGIKDGKKNINE